MASSGVSHFSISKVSRTPRDPYATYYASSPAQRKPLKTLLAHLSPHRQGPLFRFFRISPAQREPLIALKALLTHLSPRSGNLFSLSSLFSHFPCAVGHGAVSGGFCTLNLLQKDT